MHPHDRELLARDRALPGLGLVLSPAELLAALKDALPEHTLGDPRLAYLRYKPRTNCLAAYALLLDGAPTFIHATAHRADAPEKLRNAREKRRGESPLAPLVLPPRVTVRAFPTDRKLRALRCVADAPARRRLLREALPEHPELWGAGLEVLRYKPERRLVARLRAAGGGSALLKLYHKGDFGRAQAGAEAFARGTLPSAPLLGVHPEGRVLIWRWLDGRPGDTLLENPEQAAALGRALAALHAQPAETALPVTRADEGGPLRAAAESVAYLLPELGARARALAASLAAQLRAAPPLRRTVHGDFSLDQVVVREGGVAIIDADTAALGDPAWDFGTLSAQLERAVIRGDLAAADVRAVCEPLAAGYADRARLPERTALYTAAGLLRLAPHAFRTRKPAWPDETRALIARAEAFS